MLGQLDVVRAAIAASPGVQRVKGRTASRSSGMPWQVDRRRRPSSAEDARKLIGVYAYGVTPTMRVEIAGNDRNQLSFSRPGRFPRGMTHLGDLTFVPAGGEHVRVRFAEAAGTMTLTVHDPDVVLTAKKSA